MSIPYDVLVKEVLSLPTKDRALLAETAIDSLLDDKPDDVRAAWIAEIESRMAAIERGEVVFHPGEKVIAEAKKRLSP